ncbi:rho GTPase-activating protein 7 isoform X4 [Phymastichus coffea]|uniref:rho GTPase-activating protein 7 isoform X4 n=1 Tax=Phymastichus coffea TaxID=108790 RepID=UPI00273B512B|nr:rho GTPase-activating protein 7 isoform X4 [Phymastichus coffea]XP_058793833.1 rho GTPase-activating protein 7 isoform X4 [Phymastichus coffea]
MASEEPQSRCETPAQHSIEEDPKQEQAQSQHARRMSHFKEYKFFRSFSAKVENWPMRKAEALWRRMREKKIAEIEAQEACKWLRAAGFPQYAQMYEDYQFPIDVTGVAKDHPFLEADSLQSLFRRLHALNRCANMKLDTHHHHHHQHHHHHSHNITNHSKSSVGGTTGGDDSDEDTQCALSENWTFEKKTRRWSRICDITPGNVERLQAIAGQQQQQQSQQTQSTIDDSLDDRLEQDEADDTMLDTLRYRSLPPGPLPDELGTRFRRTGSERLRDGAKAFLRRMESLKSRRRKHQHNRDGVVISGPQVLDVLSMQQRMKDLNCVDVSPTGDVSFADLLLSPSPLQLQASPTTAPTTSPFHLPAPSSPMANTASAFGDDSSSYCSDGSQGGGPTPTPTKTKMNKARRFLHRGSREDQGALSDSECQPTSWRHRYFKNANSNNTKVLDYVTSSPKDSPLKASIVSNAAINTRGGSLNLGKESNRYRDKFSTNSHKEDKVAVLKREEKFHKSFRHRSADEPIRTEKIVTKEVTVYRSEKSRTTASSQESSSTVASRDSDQEEDSPRHKGNVVRWHSFQRGSLYPEPLDPLCPRAVASMSCGQLLVLRKLALLKLTACMERYCPTHRTGWNWELPKFIRKIKTPDYKDKTVFGVPLLLSLQRTGQALPKCIQIALRWLRANALDQVGIFRKSGVRSRIQKLKTMTETQGDNINFDGQQAFDVADLIKQYFRELPEALLTNKLSETFIAIFQHVPVELRPDAVQCALLLLPNEHREALETLLDFLNHVAANAPYNQMTASNLAVCLAPSLFHFNHSNANVSNRSNSVSPRRRKTVGIPDQRELSENKAAHDCLLYLIKTHRELFMVSSDILSQCHFNYMEESVPVPLEELGSELKQDWRGYLYACTSALLKEGREKSRGWVSVNNPADSNVEMAYKKVGDGHPLRLWRVTTEVEAPPEELLHRVLRERHIWDPQLLKYRQVAKLDANAEVFQYATGNMSPLPARDYCVLRSWQTDLPKKACVIVETSVEHADAPVMLGGTRGIVLASRYLIEHCGSGRSRIMHLSRVDTKGRTPEWYNKSYGHIAALHLSKIRASFKHTTDGPESKV